MNKIRLIAINFLKAIKKLQLSIIKCYRFFIQRKKSIDTMYDSVIQEKTKEVKNLSSELKDIQTKKLKLEKEVLNMEISINKKKRLIENIQDLTTKRTDY